jgi:DNA-directed RNA polymerase subunit RPC12/RpoP
METAAEKEQSIACPRCRSEDYHRSRGRGLYEKVVLKAFRRTFYRCNQCGVRFYTKRPRSVLSKP